MALSRWEVRKNKDSFFIIYLEYQGEDEADWAYEEEPAEEEVAANFLLDRVFIEASPQQVGEEVTSSEPREVTRIETSLR